MTGLVHLCLLQSKWLVTRVISIYKWDNPLRGLTKQGYKTLTKWDAQAMFCSKIRHDFDPSASQTSQTSGLAKVQQGAQGSDGANVREIAIILASSKKNTWGHLSGKQTDTFWLVVQLGWWLFPIYRKKHVPNHQPAFKPCMAGNETRFYGSILLMIAD